MDENIRDLRFDNLKGILIILVVFGHFMEINITKSPIALQLTNVVYSFHMATFSFVSGYFSKNCSLKDEYINKNIKNILIPFLLFHVLKWTFSSRNWSTVLEPTWMLWYLLCLFWWRTILSSFSKVRFAAIIAIILSILIGFAQNCNILSLTRTIAFFPFFYIGYKTQSQLIDSIKHKQIIAYIVLIASFLIVLVISNTIIPYYYIASMNNTFSLCQQFSYFQKCFFRLLVLFIGLLVTYCLFAIVPSKTTVFTKFGRYSMTIYLAHTVVIPICLRIIPSSLFEGGVVTMLMTSCFLTICICAFFGNKYVDTIYHNLINSISPFVFQIGDRF